MREMTPLAAALATERSERVGEEAEENWKVHLALTHFRKELRRGYRGSREKWGSVGISAITHAKEK